MLVNDVMKNVLEMEAEALLKASKRLDGLDLSSLGPLFKKLNDHDGSLIFCGVGKSGLVGQKIASTFMSLGLSSYFLHPTEALHGDLGRLKSGDVIVLISKSGTTEEIIKLLPYLPMGKSHQIALVGNTKSAIADSCAIVLDCSVEKEACLNNQAPTTSSTLAIAMGDAMSVVYEKEVGLSKEGFAQNHPGGLLGKSLLLQVSHLMTTVSDCPTLSLNSSLKDALVEMTKKPVGGLAVVDENNNFLGLVVDGDIRRSLAKEEVDLASSVVEIMNDGPKHVAPDDLAINGLKLMESGQTSFSILPVLDNKKFVGFLRLHDLVKEGFNTNK